MFGNDKIVKLLKVPKKYRHEFYERNRVHNNRAYCYFTLCTSFLLTLTAIIVFLLQNDSNRLLEQLNTILPLYYVLLGVSAVTSILLWLVRLQKKALYALSDIIALLHYACLIVLLYYFSTDGMKNGADNTALFTLVLFVVVFFMRFNLLTTISLQTMAAVFYAVMLTTESAAFMNYSTCMVTLFLSYFIIVIAACTFWASLLKSFSSEKNLEALLTSDFLTKVYNRRGFENLLSRTWDDAVRKNTQLSLLLMDIDHFKKYNDIYGHVEGDGCIIRIANAIAVSIRMRDYVARYGGEEFAVIMSDTDQEIAEKVAERILTSVSDLKIPHASSVTPHVTISVGGATVNPSEEDITAEDLLRKADAALYKAKAAGRNTIAFDLSPTK